MDEGFSPPLLPNEIQKGLETLRLGRKIHYFQEIDSTNAYAWRLAQEGAEEGEIVVAESQTRGRGRKGRPWFSPPYRNLYISLILRPRMPPIHAPQITLMAAVALAETVESFLSFTPEIKWPNDILVSGKKLGGILTESSCEGERILFVVLGIGVNLNLPEELMPEAIRHSATSLFMVTGKKVDRVAFARRLIQSLERCYEDLEQNGFSPGRWESYFGLRGKRVRVNMGDRYVVGKALGIDADGALLLEDEEGTVEKIISGDVLPA